MNQLKIFQLCWDLDKLSLLFRKGIYPYEYMDSWERFNENTIPPKEAFYSKLNLEIISDGDYKHVKKVWEAPAIKNLGKYVECDTLLLADVFENSRDKCVEINDPAHSLSAPRLP